MIAIAVAATKSYLHAFRSCVRSVAVAAAHLETAHFIFATDESDETRQAEEVIRHELPEGWKVTTIRLKGMDDDAKDYKHAAQLRIAALQGAAFHFAKTKLKADALWSVESDNIVPPHALRMLQWTLAMPREDGTPYYEVAAATYPNGLFLGGFGTPQNPIAEDFLPSERKLKPRLKLLLEICESRLKGTSYPVWTNWKPELKQRNEAMWMKEGEHIPREVSKEVDAVLAHEMKRMGRLRERIKKCPPDGNIWEVTAKHGWRRRGWMDFAYPGIGEGAVVPSDWCGLGCTLIGRRALALADFSGYDGGGTQDLFLCWHRWHPAGVKIACVPHVVCDHVKRQGDEIIHHRAYHEQDPAFRGHLRVRRQPWIPC
jgi:hypothetical protein